MARRSCIRSPLRSSLRAVLAASLCTVVQGSAAHASAPVGLRAACPAYASVQARLAEMQQAVARGASEDELQAPDLVGPLRACFEEQVMPQLTLAETDEAQFDQAASDLFMWGRQHQLLGLGAVLEPEWNRGAASLQRGLTHAYTVARGRCVRDHDQSQVAVMLGYARYAELFAMTVSTTLDEDLRACLEDHAYLVEATVRSESARHGTMSAIHYVSLLGAPSDEDAGGELVGAGSWGGLMVSLPANCELAKSEAPQRFHVAGRIEASGGVIDMAAPGTRPQPHLAFTLGTVDWPFLPMAGRDPFAKTAEDRDGVKGMGTIMPGRPVKLTGAVTVVTQSRSEANRCGDTRTHSTEFRITELQKSGGP